MPGTGGPDPRDLHARGLALLSAGRHADAGAVVAQALDSTAADQVALRAELTATAAWVRGETGDLSGAVALCETALGWTDLPRSGRAVLTARLAALKVRAGEADAALPLFDAAIPELGHDPETLGRALINRSYLYLRRHELVSAAADLTRAEGAFAEVGDEVEQAKVRHNRGYVALLAGDLVGALQQMDLARTTLRHLSPGHRAVCDLDRAEVLEAAGLSAEATQTLREVVDLLADSDDWHTLAEAELTLARFLSADDPSGAVRLAEHASHLFADQGNATAALRATAVATHASILDPDAPSPPLRVLDDLADALDERHVAAEGADLRIRAAEVALRDGDLPGARSRIARLGPADTVPLRTTLLAATVTAALDRASGSAGDALATAGAAMDLHGRWQESFGSLSLQFATQQRVQDLVLQGLNAAWDTRDPTQVLAWSERARGVAARWNPVRSSGDVEVRAALAELRHLGDSDEPDAVLRRAELQAAVREHGWAHRPPTGEPEPSAEPLQRALADAGASMATYLWLGDRLVALTLDDGAERLHDLGPWSLFADLVDGLPADLDMAAARLSPGLVRAVHSSLRARLEDLDTLLIRPMVDGVRHQRVVLTVPGILAGVPWGLLPSLADRSLSVPVSAGWWIGSRSVPTPGSNAVAVIAGPGTEHGVAEGLAVADAWSRSGAVTVAMHEAATATRAQEIAVASDVLHVCAHGGHSTEHPLFSSVGLADGPWFGHDVEQLASVPRLVVVSACEMGRSVGEFDALGMARAWLHAGAHCVIAAPSNISDATAAAVLPRVHGRIAAGAAPGDALAAERVPLDLPVLCYGNAW